MKPALILALCLSMAMSASASAASPDVDAAMETLRTARVFEGRAVGVGGELSAGVRSFRVLLQQDDAADKFVALAREGGTAGRLYAAIGLQALDDQGYAEVVRELRLVEHTSIDIRSGCIGRRVRIGELLESTQPSAVRLAPGETLSDWFVTHRSGTLDVVGGGYAADFRASSL